MDSFRYFYLKFQFFQIIPKTVRQQNSVNSLYSGAPYPTQSLKKPPPKKGGRLFRGDTSRFTGHLAHNTQSRHLIVLQRMTALNSIWRMPRRYRTALSCITLLLEKPSDWIEQRRFFKRSRWSNAPDGHSRITHARSKRIRRYTKYHFANDN